MSSNNPDTENEINPGLRHIIYCTAISKGDEREWDFLWERLKKTNNANEKSTILSSLACTKHIWMLRVRFEYNIMSFGYLMNFYSRTISVFIICFDNSGT